MTKAMEKQSPLIKKHEWGKLWLEDHKQPLKDAKLYPGGAREWDWNETGTRHKPGIQKADADDVLKNGAQWVVLSTGVYEQLNVPETTINYLKDQNVQVEVAQTEQAIEVYNRLVRQGYAAGGLFHSTC
jgi:hypothetical protein